MYIDKFPTYENMTRRSFKKMKKKTHFDWSKLKYQWYFAIKFSLTNLILDQLSLFRLSSMLLFLS